MNFAESIKTCFKKYATFSGRASRSEFWWWMLFVMLYNSLLGFFFQEGAETEAFKNKLLENSANNNFIETLHSSFVDAPTTIISLLSLIVLFPTIAVKIRRLHDINYGGWWIAPYIFALSIVWIEKIYQSQLQISLHSFATLSGILVLLMMVYPFILLILLIKKGTIGDNRFGKDPLAENN